jgi:ferredoxin
VYRHEAAYNRDPDTSQETLDQCKACLSCVQGCTKGLLSVSVNPGYLDMGDDYWKPDTINTTWNQADNGKVPVSGAGYRGRFHGPGFDSIWTDMSEIVRPTRDGIHGREYISTSVDIGIKPMRLEFGPGGELLSPPARLLELQLPAILDLPGWQLENRCLTEARAIAAGKLSSVAVVPAAEATGLPAGVLPDVVPLLAADETDAYAQLLGVARMTELIDGPDAARTATQLHDAYPALVVAVRLSLTPTTADRLIELVQAGVKVFHVCADRHGRERLDGGRPGRHIKDAVRAIHGRLVKEGLRDEVTLIVGGGIALAEHMAKAVICGADLVAVDTPLLIALGCRVCGGGDLCYNGRSCPAGIDSIELPYATQRLVNLMGAWHSQLIEVLGAMGIREVRRLRGEVGRAIFLEDIEKEAFGDLDRVSPSEVIA